MRLIDGAHAILGDLPSQATHLVDVPMEAGEALDTGVHRFSSILTVRDRVTFELRALESPVVTVGGDCGADLASVQHAVRTNLPGSMALLWFDAHADLNDGESSDSGAFGGMVLRALLGDGPDGLGSNNGEAVAADHLVLAGVRALDDGESDYIDAAGIRLLSVDELRSTDALLAALEATGASRVYIHIDLDVLDPAAIAGVGYPEPFGLEPERLSDLIRSVRRRFDLAGAAVTGFAPESLEAANHDLPVILRVLGALTAPVAA